MTKAIKSDAAADMKITAQQAAVWAHITEDWQTVNDIFQFAASPPHPRPVAKNTVKNVIKWLLDIGVIIQAPHVSPARYRFNDDNHPPRPVLDRIIALNNATDLYGSLED